MANAYTQDIILDADGKPVLDALGQVRAFMADIQKVVAGIGVTSKEDARAWAQQLALNLKMLKQAESDLRTLQADRANRGKGFQAAEGEAKRIAGAEVRADKEANSQKLIEAKVLYREKARIAKEEAGVERQLAKEVADFERSQDRAAIASAREVAAARREAATAAVTAKARGINNLDDVRTAKTASDARLGQLRREREVAAGNDVAAARALADRIALERTLGRELDARGKQLLRDDATRQTRAEREQKTELIRLTREQARVEREAAAQRRADTAAAAASLRELSRGRAESGKATAYSSARSITDPVALVNARANNVAELQRLRALRDAETSPEKNRELAALVEIEKARARGLKEANAELQKMQRQQSQATARLAGVGLNPGAITKALIPGDVRDMAQQRGAKDALLGYRFEQEAARKALQSATSEQEKADALILLERANLRVRAAQQLVREEEKLVQIDQRLAQSQRLEQTKAQVALSGQYAREQIAALGPKEAIRRAAEATAAAEQRLLFASKEQLTVARQELEVAKAQEKAVQQQGRNPLSAILSPGYAVNAFARTSIYGAAAGAAYGVFNAAQGGFGQAVEMEDELAKLQAIANATDTQMQTLKASIYGVGESSRYSVVDLAKISQTLAQAGVSAGEMESVLKAVTTLATASGSTPDEAVNLVTAALGSFQLQASEASRIADLMTSALNRTKLTVQQTGQAIQYVGATAFEQNISLETLLATVGAIAQAGVRSGSTIGTGFRQFLVDLQTPSEKLAAQLKAVGLSATDVNVSVRGLPAVLNSLRDAGFGSAQAYQGLETRAAAFYLVAKNNTDTMQQLQIAFTQQGAAAAANERAMNSLSAQWQRFKNIISEGFNDSLETPMRFLQDLLKQLSDRQMEMDQAAERLSRAKSGGLQGYQQEYGGFSGTVQYSLNSAGDRVMQEAADDIRNILNGFGLTNLAGVKGLGDQWVEYTQKISGASRASDEFETKLANASEKAQAQAGKISELDKEMGRLLTQQDSLKGNTLGVATETATLTARFDGLAKFLTNATDKYGDLIGAMQKYRAEALTTQTAYLNGQRSLLGGQAARAEQNATNYANRILSNPELMGQLTAREQEAVKRPRAGANGTVIADAGARLNNSDLRSLSIELGTLATSVAEQRIVTTQLNNTIAENTAAGRSLSQRTVEAESMLTKFASLTQAEQIKQAPSIRAAAQGVKTEAVNRLANPATAAAARPTLESYTTRADAVLKGITAALAPTKAEAQAAAKAERERKKAEREAERREKLVTQGDIDGIGQSLGLKLGSGTRTPAEQEALFRRGVTPARGTGPRTSNHVNGIARDFSVAGLTDEEAERRATTLRQRYKAQGIEAQVKYERGGRNDGTGRHIHVGVRKGARRRADNLDELEDRNELQTQKSQIGLDEENLKLKLKEIGKTTSEETFNSAVDAAKAALEKVNGQLENAAKDEMALSGILPNSPEYQTRLLQVKQTIAQNVEEFNQSVTDAIIKSITAQTKAAQTAFDAAVQPAEAKLATAQAQLSGFEMYSLRNKVPDYVKSLASDRVAMAQEGVAKAQYNALPAQITAQQALIDNTQAKIGTTGADPVQLAAQIATMNVELQKLVTTRDALGAQLGAGGLIPTNFKDGLDQAIQAYRQANNLSNTFSQDLTMNLGGALDTVNSGLETMFTSILDGSQTALQAFGNFAKGIMQWMIQLAARAVATKIFSMILGAIGGAAGGGGGQSGGVSAAQGMANYGPINLPAVGSFNGGPVGAPIGRFEGGPITPKEILHRFEGGPILQQQALKRFAGGSVENGSVAADSVTTNLARGEWVMQKKAVDSVGNHFMARLNQHGSKALEGLQTMPSLDMKNHTETNVYVVPAAQQPQLGPNDVRIILTDELMNGDGKRLVQHISRER